MALRANVAQFQAQMGAASAHVKAFGTDVGSTLTSVDRDTQKAVETISKGALVMGAGLLAGFGVAVGAAANFQKEMSGVQAVSGATGAEMKLLGEAALKAGADTSFSASEAARGQAELAKAGISTADILGGALTGSLALAAAGQLDVAQAAEISAQAMNIFGLSGSDVGRIADVLAAGANKSAADVGQLGDALRQGGLVAEQTGLTLEETVGTLAAFADNALVGSDAGTSLKTMLQRLTPSSKESAEMMAQLGFSAFDAQGNFIGMEALAGELQTSLGGLTQEQRNTALATMFGSDAIRGANILLDQGAPGIARYIGLVHDQGFATRSAAELTNNLAGDVERLGGSIETALIRSGSGANTVLREMVQFATGAVNAIGELPAPLLAAGTGFAGIAGSALLVLGGIGTLIPKLREVQLALAGMGSTGIATAGILSTVGKAFGIAGLITGTVIALDAVGRALFDLNPDLVKLQQGLLDLGRTGDAAAILRELETDAAGFKDAIGLASTEMGAFEQIFKGFVDPAGTKNIDDAKQKVEGLDQSLADLVRSAGPEVAGRAFDGFAKSLGLSQSEIDALRPQLDAYNGALSENKLAADAAAAAQGDAAGATGVLGGAMGDTALITEEQKKEFEANAKAAEELAKVHQSYADAAGGFVDPVRAWNEVVEEATTKAREHAEKVAESTADTKDSWEDYVVEASGSLDGFMEKLQGQINAQDEWARNLKTIAARGRVDVVDELTLMGKEGADIVAALADAEGAELNRGADLIVEAARRGSLEYGSELDVGMKAAAEIVRQGGGATVKSVMDALGPMPGLTADLVRSVAQGMGTTLEEARPAWELQWQERKNVSLQEMDALLRDAPPKVQEATGTINQHLIDTNPAFAAEFASRHGVSVEEMNRLLANAPPIVREAVDLINQHTTDTQPLFAQSWGDRKTVSLTEMRAMLADAPPVARDAVELINRHLIDTNPAFAEQFRSRKGVSVEEMNRLLAEAPPPVRAAVDTINRFVTETEGPFNGSWLSRGRYALDRMREMARDTPPQAAAAGEGLNRELANRLPPFQRTVEGYQNSLSSGIRTVQAALGSGLAGAAYRAHTQADGGIVEFYAAGGMKETHQAQIARAGDWRVWAEPETGGEAYIPLALAKRERSTAILEEVARRFGLAVTDYRALPPGAEYHDGGLWCEDEHEHQGCHHFHSGGLYVPPPHPQFNDYGPPIQPAGSGTTHSMREVVAEAARRHMQEAHHQAPPPGPGGAPGADPGGSGGNIVAVGRRMQGMGYRVGEHPSFGGVAPVHTKNSYHYRGRAIDVNWYPASAEPAKLDYLHGWIRQNVSPVTELLWRTKGHYGHLHLAMLLGGLVDFRSFDQGGWLEPGLTLAHNGTGVPERVISFAEGGLRGDTFYGDPGGFRKRERRFSDEEGAQFDYMNRRETRARPHERLDWGTPHREGDNIRPSDEYRAEWKAALEASREAQEASRQMRGLVGATAGQGTRPAPITPVPTNVRADNSVNVTIGSGAVRVDVRAEVGAEPSGMRRNIARAVEEALGAFQASLSTEIRARRR